MKKVYINTENLLSCLQADKSISKLELLFLKRTIEYSKVSFMYVNTYTINLCP
jgi:hypothetical protein